MSGIAGIFQRDGRPLDRAELERQSRVLAHRGGDGSGLWLHGSVGLVHRLREITPESVGEHQPLVSRDGRFVLVADARIDDRVGLARTLGIARSELTRDGAPLRDSELILAAYEHFGEHCVQHIVGDFAFALWDARERKLFCARDHTGMRPFYYRDEPADFAFASEVRGLTEGLGRKPELDELGFARHLVQLDGMFGATAVRGVSALPPAHTLTVDGRGTRLRCYWRLDTTREIRLASAAEYHERYRELLESAVRDRLRSVHPVACELSGGLDSTLLACLASRELRARGDRLRTVSWHPPVPAGTAPEMEPPFARVLRWCEVASADAHVGIPGGASDAKACSHVASVERALQLNGLPLQDPNYTGLLSSVDAAAARGARVVLSGNGGDEFATARGLGFATDLARRRQWRALVRERREHHRARALPPPSARALLSYAVVQGLPPPAYRLLSRLRPSVRDVLAPFVEAGAIRAERASALGVASDQATHYRVGRAPLVFPERSVWRLEMGHAAVRASMSDHLGAAAGVEYAHPLLDRRLLEFCVGVPIEQHVSPEGARLMARRALGQLVPPEVLRADKRADRPRVQDRPRDRSVDDRQISERLRALEQHASAARWVDVARLRRYLLEPSSTVGGGALLHAERGFHAALFLEGLS